MPGTNLTRAEAAERAKLLRVHSYQVELDLTSGSETFRSATRIAFQCEQPGAATFVDLIAPQVHEIVLNGRQLDPSAVYIDSRIELDDLAADNVLEVVADCAYVNTGAGPHCATAPADGNVSLYTPVEVPDAWRVLPGSEQPDRQATWQLAVAAPGDWQVASGSPPPEPKPMGEASARWEFAATPPISTYITALVAGLYHVVRDRHTVGGKVIPLALYC